jgi:hypothetical protein
MADDPKVGELASPQKPELFIQSYFKRGAEFAAELLRENERLRFRLLELEARTAPSAGEASGPPAELLRQLARRIEELEAERQRLLRGAAAVEEENRDWKRRYAEVERENANLANLYVALHQLHSTLELREVVHIVLEILLNFVGAKTLAIYLLDDRDGTLHPIAACGIPRERAPIIRSGEGVLGRTAKSGQSYLDGGIRMGELNLTEPAIATPLRVGDETVGVVAIWDFLAQKTALAEVDFELFNLLSSHAAVALLAAERNAQAGGKPLRLAELRDWL